jgi:hypothetical protein
MVICIVAAVYIIRALAQADVSHGQTGPHLRIDLVSMPCRIESKFCGQSSDKPKSMNVSEQDLIRTFREDK